MMRAVERIVFKTDSRSEADRGRYMRSCRAGRHLSLLSGTRADRINASAQACEVYDNFDCEILNNYLTKRTEPYKILLLRLIRLLQQMCV